MLNGFGRMVYGLGLLAYRLVLRSARVWFMDYCCGIRVYGLVCWFYGCGLGVWC